MEDIVISAGEIIIQIIGGVCLLLWGVNLIGSGLNKAFGSQLRKFISTSTDSRFKAFGVGAFSALVLQSSMATCVIASSFAVRNIITLPAAIAVMIGADVGTTLSAQLMSLDLAWLMPVMMTMGYAVSKIMKDTMYKNLGGFFVGIALVLLALAHITSTAAYLKNSETLHLIMLPLQQQPVLAVAFSAIITWVVHSSLGMVLLYTGLASSGVLPIDIALYMVLGSNLGGAIAPVILTASEVPSGRRIPIANLIIKVITVIAIMPFMSQYILPFIEAKSLIDTRIVVNFHTAFNLFVALLSLPIVSYLSNFLLGIIPDPKKEDDTTRPRHLDATALSNPRAALACASREVFRVCEIVQQMFDDSLTVLRNNDYKLLLKICDDERTVDSLYIDIKEYLSHIERTNMTDEDIFKYMQILKFSTNLEYMGDVIDKGLMNSARKKINAQDSFSRQGYGEIASFHENVKCNIKDAQNLLMTADLKMAEDLVERKIKLRENEQSGMENHLKRLSQGIVETKATSTIHMDIIRDFMRINSHASAIAYDVIKMHQQKDKK